MSIRRASSPPPRWPPLPQPLFPKTWLLLWATTRLRHGAIPGSMRRGKVVLQEVQSTSTSGGGLSGGAPRSTPVTSLTWPRNQMVNSSPEVASSVNDFSMSGASNRHQHEAPHRRLLQSPSLPVKSRPGRLSLEPLAALPHARGGEVPSFLFFTGKDREHAIESRRALARRARPNDRLGALPSKPLLERPDADDAAALDIDPNSVRPAHRHRRSTARRRPHRHRLLLTVHH
jgi:hypothetical protein